MLDRMRLNLEYAQEIELIPFFEEFGQPDQELLNHPLVKRAEAFAIAAHFAIDQKRKYTGEPYIVHPGVVARLVACIPGATPEMVAAGWLHDTVEDTGEKYRHLTTGITLNVILHVFGAQVQYLVAGVTKSDYPREMPREERRDLEVQRISAYDCQVKTLKVCDLIRSILRYDPGFARECYAKENRQLLDIALVDANKQVWNYADRMLKDMIQQLDILPENVEV